MSDPRGYDDELISAYLDGEASPDEADRIERDPQAQARATELAAVQAAVADPVPPLANAERDRLRADAVAAAAPDAAVRPISAARQRRPRAFIPVAAAAGIAAVVLGAMAVLRSTDDGSEDSTAASAPATAVQPASDDSAGAAAESAAASDMAFAEEDEMADMTAEAENDDSAFGYDMAEAEESETAAEPEPLAAATTMADMDAAPEIEAPDEAPDPAGDGADPEPTDLGSFVGLEQLIDRLALLLADDDDLTGPFTEPGLCARPVAERVAELSAEVFGEARAELEDSAGADPGGPVDLAVATTGDGNLLLVYAVEPNCEVEVAALE